MSMRSAMNRDTSDHDSMESDIEFVEWRAVGKRMAKSTIKSESEPAQDANINDKLTTESDEEQGQRLHGGSSPAYDTDDLSVPSTSSAVEDEPEIDFESGTKRRRTKYMRIAKISVLFVFWVVFTTLLLIKAEHEHATSNFICVPNGTEKIFHVPEESTATGFYITTTGPFVMISKEHLQKIGDKNKMLTIKVVQSIGNGTETRDVTKAWILNLANTTQKIHLVERKRLFALERMSPNDSKKLHISFVTNIPEPLALEFYYEATPINLVIGITIALLLVIGFHILLMMDIVHRALAVIVFCTLSISMLAMLNLRPSLRTIINWINFEVLLLLFGFTLIIAILAETGIIDYLTLRTYEFCNGHIWPILNCLCLITFIGASLIDSVFMILLIAPITMRISEVMELNPVPLLTCLIISSNVGATLAPDGETPTNYIRGQEVLRREGIDALLFIEHILPGILIAGTSAYLYMRIIYHDSNSMRFKDGAEIERLRRVISVWSRTAKSISAYSQDEKAMRDTVLSKVRRLRKRLKRIGKMPTPASNYDETLNALKSQYQITDTVLLVKCCIVFGFVLLLVLLHIIPDVHYLSTAWTALLACILLLILAGTEDFDGILGRIEWSTMLFLACAFVFSKTTVQLGLYEVICNVTENLIKYSGSSMNLFVGILIVVWFSALCSTILTDSSVSSMMLHTVINAIEEIDENRPPVQPLVWAVILGTGLGGITTIIGSYENVICAGLAEKHGYHFPFLYYCKVGFPIMLVCVSSITVYLMVAHVLFHWH
ncbi:P protein-like [Anastrepha obliqua]|uniref:P protein-like n=1 Tax=Anastrepha obliqua TaxID=95512 RepID=UPI0024097575|nr:P protein-like [Anastrepha obliqua]XP_054737621.1 P protein-like [Anastrepha obliqua]